MSLYVHFIIVLTVILQYFYLCDTDTPKRLKLEIMVWIVINGWWPSFDCPCGMNFNKKENIEKEDIKKNELGSGSKIVGWKVLKIIL